MITATIAGRVGKDAAQDGERDRVRWTVAVEERGRDGERTTTWVDCTLFGRRGHTLAPYITKGSSIAVTGRLRVWSRKDGTVGIGIDASEVTLLGGGAPRGEATRGEATRAPAPAAHDPSESW